MVSTTTEQIRPYIPHELKAKLDALAGERDVTVSAIVTTALRQYFGDLEQQEDRLDVLTRQVAQLMTGMNTLLASRPSPDDPIPPLPADVAPVEWTDDGRVLAEPKRRGWWGRP